MFSRSSADHLSPAPLPKGQRRRDLDAPIDTGRTWFLYEQHHSHPRSTNLEEIDATQPRTQTVYALHGSAAAAEGGQGESAALTAGRSHPHHRLLSVDGGTGGDLDEI